MRVLLISHSFPLPALDGGRIAFLNTLKSLARTHEVGVVCLVGGNEDTSIQDLERLCKFVKVFKRSRHQDPLRILAGMVLEPPGAGFKYWYPGAGDLIRRTIRAWKPEMIEFHHLHTAVYQRFCTGVPTILREHNVEHKVWERHAQHVLSWPARAHAKWSTPRVRRYEAAMACRFDRCVVVSNADAEYLRGVSPRVRVDIVPFGVDPDYFSPFSESEEKPFRMALTGSFEWRPKQHNLRILLAEIMPRVSAIVPEAELYVVGAGVPADLLKLAERTPGVTVTGRVPDVRPFVATASLVLNYVESGGGIAMKVLEAMAMQKPVLSNSLGCEGIEVEHGRDVFLADGVEAFAQAAGYLLTDPCRRRGLAMNGRKRAEEGYSWTAIAGQMDRCYESVLKEYSERATGTLSGCPAT